MTVGGIRALAGGQGLAAALFTTAAVCATLGALLGAAPLLAIAAGALGAFVLIEWSALRRPQLIATLILLAVAVLVAMPRGEILHTFGAGLVKTLPFLLVFATVGWLRSAAEQSPSVAALRAGMARMGAGRRFASLTLSAHALGAGFNLAGIALLAPMLADSRDDPALNRRMSSAILWGFSSASSWSPFLVGTAAVLAAIPAADWLDTLPYGLTIAALLLLWALIFDRLTLRPAGGDAPEPRPPALVRPVARLLAAIALLFAMTLGMIEGLGLSLTTAIAIAGPVFASGWVMLVHRRAGAVVGTARTVISGYPGMRTETTLFVAANIFGVAVSDVLPAYAGGLLSHWDGGLSGVFMLDALVVIWIYLAVCALGIHPIVSLVVFTSVIDPAALGIAPPVLAAAMMALWGMGTSVSPLSGTTLFMSQLSGVSSFEIAWRWNGVFWALAALMLATMITIAG